MSDFVKHESALEELADTGTLSVKQVMEYIRAHGMIKYDCNRCSDSKMVGLSIEGGGFGIKDCPDCTPCPHPEMARRTYCNRCKKDI